MKAIVNSTKPLSENSGFTLLEVLIAMVIISIGALGLAMMQGTTVQANSYSNKLSQATALGQSMIEQLSATELDDLMGSGTESYVNAEGSVGADGPFTRSWTVAENSDFSKRITVTVSWTDSLAGGDSKTRNVQFSTITRGAYN